MFTSANNKYIIVRIQNLLHLTLDHFKNIISECIICRLIDDILWSDFKLSQCDDKYDAELLFLLEDEKNQYDNKEQILDALIYDQRQLCTLVKISVDLFSIADNYNQQLTVKKIIPLIPNRPILDYCQIHCFDKDKSDPNIGFELIYVNNFNLFSKDVIKLIKQHKNNEFPLSSFFECFSKTIFDSKNEVNYELKRADDRGLPLEYLLTSIACIKVVDRKFSSKYVVFCDESPSIENSSTLNDSNLSTSFLVDQSSQEATTNNNRLQSKMPIRPLAYDLSCLLLKKAADTKYIMPLKNLASSYRKMFGPEKYLSPMLFNENTLIDLINRLEVVLLLMGEGDQKYVTLHPSVHKKRFMDLISKIFDDNSVDEISFEVIESELNSQNQTALDFGMFTIYDLIQMSRDNKEFIKSYSTDTIGDCKTKIIKRKSQSFNEHKFNKFLLDTFRIDVVSLLALNGNYSLPLIQFIPSFHHFTHHQCKVEEYGHRKLIDLLLAVDDIIEIVDCNNGSQTIKLRMEFARIAAEKDLETYLLSKTDYQTSLSNIQSNLISFQFVDFKRVTFLTLSKDQVRLKKNLLDYHYQLALKILVQIIKQNSYDDNTNNDKHAVMDNKKVELLIGRMIQQKCKMDIKLFVDRFLINFLSCRLCTDDDDDRQGSDDHQNKLLPNYIIELKALSTFLVELYIIFNASLITKTDDEKQWISQNQILSKYVCLFGRHLHSSTFGYIYFDRMLHAMSQVLKTKRDGRRILVSFNDDFKQLLK